MPVTVARAYKGVSSYQSKVRRGVSMNINCKSKPYLAKLRRDGKHVHLGCFVTPEEAALAFARSSAAHAASSRKRKAEPEEEQEDAEDDDVEVVVLDAYELFE